MYKSLIHFVLLVLISLIVRVRAETCEEIARMCALSELIPHIPAVFSQFLKPGECSCECYNPNSPCTVVAPFKYSTHSYDGKTYWCNEEHGVSGTLLASCVYRY